MELAAATGHGCQRRALTESESNPRLPEKRRGEKILSCLWSRRGITLRMMLTVHFAGVRQLILCYRAGSQVKKDWSREFDQTGGCILASKADIVCPPFLSRQCL